MKIVKKQINESIQLVRQKAAKTSIAAHIEHALIF